jgi:hypothetical protein
VESQCEQSGLILLDQCTIASGITPPSHCLIPLRDELLRTLRGYNLRSSFLDLVKNLAFCDTFLPLNVHVHIYTAC